MSQLIKSIIRNPGAIFPSNSQAWLSYAPVLFLFFVASAVNSQTLFLDGEYVLPNRAAAMSAYVADPDYSHAISLNPAKLGFVQVVHFASDAQTFTGDAGKLFLGDTSSHPFQNGRFASWDASTGFPAGPVGVGLEYSSLYMGGWHTTISGLGLGYELPFGFAIGATAKLVDFTRLTSSSAAAVFDSRASLLTFDVGVENRTTLADNTFFRALISSGATFSNVLSRTTLNPIGQPDLQPGSRVDVPSVLTCGVGYLFASNYRLADFELFRLSFAADYSHIFMGSSPIDDLINHHDRFSFGIEASALGVLSVRLGYVLKSPSVSGEDAFNNLVIAEMGTGFSYGMSLRFPLKLVLPVVPVTSLEISYAKSPEWSSGMYHDLFGITCEAQF